MGAGNPIALGGPINPSVFNTMVQPTGVGQSTATNATGLSSALGTTSTAAPMQASTYDTSAPPTPEPMATPMPIMGSTPTVGNANTATLGTGQTSSPYQGSGNPYIQAAQATTMGNLYGAQAATQANRINQNTPYGSLNYTQGVDQYGNPTWTANQQLSPELQALTQSSLAGLQQSQANPMYGINPGETYSSAIMSRLQPIQQQQQDRVKAQLANQGIVPGTEAYNRAQTQLAQQQNDQLTSAIVGGMQTGLSAQQLQNQQAANIKNLSNPNYVNPYTQAAVAGPDYLGAYTTGQAAQIAAQNAQNAKTANLQNGLFGLGSSAILGAGGIGNLGTSILNGATTLGGLLGLGSNAANLATNANFGTNGLTSGLINGGVTGNAYDAAGNLVSTGNSAPAAADWATSFANGW